MTVTVNTSVSGGAGASSGTGSSYLALSSAAFDALVAASGLVEGTTYYIDELPAMWLGTGASTYVGISFVSGGIIYYGDEASAAQTEVDLAAGTWATRPTSGFDTGIQYYRRMTNVGSQPGGCVMSWLGGTSTEWRVTAPTWVALSISSVAGVAQTALQVINPLALQAGILKAGSFFDLRFAPSKTGTAATLTPTPYLGPNGTTADTALRAGGTVTSGGGLNKGFWQTYKVSSDSEIQLLGANLGNGNWTGAESSTATFTPYAVDVTAALNISLGVSQTSAADTPACAFLGILLHP